MSDMVCANLDRAEENCGQGADVRRSAGHEHTANALHELRLHRGLLLLLLRVPSQQRWHSVELQV
jgi:hypothetical protein